jgi:hypothetical protein
MRRAGRKTLAVNPANLIPACGECNHAKSSAVLDILHPYYDNARWLSARVLETSPPAVQLAAQPPASWPSGLADRVHRHFATFKLGLLYSMQAARLISGIEARLDDLLRGNGLATVRDHFRQDEESWRRDGLNSWQAACYAGAGGKRLVLRERLQVLSLTLP